MPVPNQDIHSMMSQANEAAEESLQQDTPTPFKVRGKSKYMRKAIVRILSLSKKEREVYEPRNGFEEAALALFKAATKDTSTGVSAWKEIKQTLGEQVGTNWKETVDSRSGSTVVVNDIPVAERKPQ
jgi:hypothetical protein